MACSHLEAGQIDGAAGGDPPEAIYFLERLRKIQDAHVAHRDDLERKVMTLV